MTSAASPARIARRKQAGRPIMGRAVSPPMKLGLRIEQRKGEWPTAFWREVVLSLCKKMGVNHSKLKVQFRKRLSDPNADADYHFSGVLRIKPPAHITATTMESLFESMAHELQHAKQYQTGQYQSFQRNEAGERGSTWEGTFYPEDYPYRDRPWEVDARKAGERYGPPLYQEMKSKGMLPLSKQEKLRSKQPFSGPTLGDWEVLTDEEQDEDIRLRKTSFKDWMELWRERYKTGWRGLDAVRSQVGKVAQRVAKRKVANDQHQAQIALMKFLSAVARQQRVGDHVYVVGGAVRNFIIDRPIKDIDVVIDAVALGEKFRKPRDSEWFAKTLQRAIPAQTDLTTNQYGVAILTVKGDWELDAYSLKGEVIEIANARKESYGGAAGKGYKPDQVDLATIEEDVLRREFTFNTLLWRLQDLASGPEKAEIIDLTGCGLRDLRDMTMRCPRDPDTVFSDDPTRMLRLIKFSAKYGFTIPSDVAASAKKNADKMKQAPWEAIASIFINNVLNEPTASSALKQMKTLGLLDVVAEMVQEQKPFATYLSKQLRNRNVSLLLDLLDLGLTDPSPLRFLSREQQQRLREITVSMPSDEADAFMRYLTKPPVDNNALISDFSLQGSSKSLPVIYAREALLDHPDLYPNSGALDRAVRGLFRAKGTKRQARGCVGGATARRAFQPDGTVYGIGGVKTLPQNKWEEVAWSELSDYMKGSIWDVYDLSYGKIGKHVPDIKKFGDKYQYLYLIDVDEDVYPDAFLAYKQTHAGSKIALGGTDGTRKAKKAMILKMKELIRQPGWYAEASHKVADILESAGMRPIDDEEVVRKTLKGKAVEWLGDGKYSRQLGKSNISAAKSLYGTPRVAMQLRVAQAFLSRRATTLESRIPGGRAEGRLPGEFDPDELTLGIDVEQEHLVGGDYSKQDREDTAREIAMDHLTEIPDYYTRLNKMESEAGVEQARGKQGAAPKKYEHINFVPPEGVANAAAKGLELRQKASPSNKGGLTPAEASKHGIGSGVQRAVNLKNRDPASPKVIKQIRGFLSRSEKSSEISAENRGTPWNDKGYVAWLLWGGDPAKAWVAKVIKQMEAADEKESRGVGKSARFQRIQMKREAAAQLRFAWSDGCG